MEVANDSDCLDIYYDTTSAYNSSYISLLVFCVSSISSTPNLTRFNIIKEPILIIHSD